MEDAELTAEEAKRIDKEFQRLCEEMARPPINSEEEYEPNACTRGVISEQKATAFLLAMGYEVFKNVSFFGPVDMIAVKDDEVIFIDVKTHLNTTVDNRQATPEQIARNVKFLVVDLETGFCELKNPALPAPVVCCVCGSTFTARKQGKRQIYCSRACEAVRRHDRYYARRDAAL